MTALTLAVNLEMSELTTLGVAPEDTWTTSPVDASMANCPSRPTFANPISLLRPETSMVTSFDSGLYLPAMKFFGTPVVANSCLRRTGPPTDPRIGMSSNRGQPRAPFDVVISVGLHQMTGSRWFHGSRLEKLASMLSTGSWASNVSILSER